MMEKMGLTENKNYIVQKCQSFQVCGVFFLLFCMKAKQIISMREKENE